MPYEMYAKQMEIPDIELKLEAKFTGCQLYIVPEQLKRRAALQKKYRSREKVGTIDIDLKENANDNADGIEDDFDDVEQVYFQKQPQCKYKYMYGSQDMRTISIFELPPGDNEERILIEIPQFRNFLLYNLLAVRLLDVLKPRKVHLFVEETEHTAEVSTEQQKSAQMMSEFLDGSYRGPCGELGLTGAAASFLNRIPLVNVDFIAVERSTDIVNTLYL